MKIIILYEGGFGVINSLVKAISILEKNNYKIIILYQKKRHNKKISLFFKNKIIWLNITFIDFFLRKYSFVIRLLLAKLLKLVLKLFYKEIFLQNEYLSRNLNYNFWTRSNNIYWPDYIDHHLFFLNNNFENKEIPKINYKVNYIKKKYYKKINIKFRKRENSSDYTARIRNSSNIENYISAINNLSEMDCLIYLSGDINVNDVERCNLTNKKNIIFNNKKSKNEEYEIYSYSNSDCIIGPHSGATNFNIILYKPQLILDAYPIGHSWIRSTMSYKFFNDPKINVRELLEREKFPINERLDVRNSTSNELKKIIEDYVINFKENYIYGYKNKDLGFEKKTHIELTDSRISKKWAELNHIKNFPLI